ncbi:MAG: ABC transporter permease [Chitinivibrionales bacterium]|nr:ABC transporter permease [Chitinivibrionales bacterium]
MEKNLSAQDNNPAHVWKKGESLTAVYMRRFKKHTLGKVGFVILIVLYSIAVLADFLSPFTMTWTDKMKSYHPPTPIVAFYTDGGKTRFRPFVYELTMENAAFKTYSIVPGHTMRIISQEKLAYKPELRAVSLEDNAQARRSRLISEVCSYYRIPQSDPVIQSIGDQIDACERDPASDCLKRVRATFTDRTGQTSAINIMITKGNKNFLSLCNSGVPYKFIGLFTANRHAIGSQTGGFFPVGTDVHGRDVLSRLFHGSRISLSVGIIGALITFCIGLLIGGVAGYFGGAADILIMRGCEVIIAFPSLYLLFALRATFPPTLSSTNVYLLIVIIISFFSWASLARIIRGLVLSLKNEEYVLCAQSMGLSHLKIIVKHILPNTLSFVIIQATLTIPFFILSESALSLLGLGITDPQSSWGLMLAVARNVRVIQSFPWILSPGFLIFIAIMAWNFFGDGIRDAVDPRSKH